MNRKSVSELAFDHKKKTPRKARFLTEMDTILPWSLLLKPIKRGYPGGARGRPSVPAGTLLRLYFLQPWYGLSDPGAEDELYDSKSMRRFAGVDLDPMPDESTICKCRHYLERKKRAKKLFELTESYQSEKGLIMSEGTIVDASIISAPGSTQNKDKARAPEMKQTKKGNQWYVGMKTHIGTDTQGRVHSVVVTDVSVHDSAIMDDLIHVDADAIYSDKACASTQRQEDAEDNGVTWRVNRKANRGKKRRASRSVGRLPKVATPPLPDTIFQSGLAVHH